MEERRLRTILSHLSPASHALAGKSATGGVLKGKIEAGAGDEGIGDRSNLPITILDDLRLSPRCRENLKFHDGCSDAVRARQKREPRARLEFSEYDSSSGLQENPSSGGQMLSSSNRGEAANTRTKPTVGQIEQRRHMSKSSSTSTGEITGNLLQPCAPQPQSRMHSFANRSFSSDELSIQVCRGMLRSRTSGGDFENQLGSTLESTESYRGLGHLVKGDGTGENTSLAALKPETEQVYGGDAQALEAQRIYPRFSGEGQTISGMLDKSDGKYKLENNGGDTDRKGQGRTESPSRERVVSSEVQGAEENSDANAVPEGRAEMRGNLSAEGKGNHKQAVVKSQQGDAMTQGIFKRPVSLQKQDVLAIRSGLNIPNLQALRFRNEALRSMQVRSNSLTGQRRATTEDCIFCRIVQGQSPAFKLYEDDMCICILDVHPLSHGHSLIVPKAHFPSLEFTPPEVAAAMCAAVPLISSAIMEATNCDSFNLLVNSGTAAGQVVFHTHFHIIPRRLGDNLWRSEGACRRPLPAGHETSLLLQKIRHKLSGKPILQP